jgi:hypothetical protein
MKMRLRVSAMLVAGWLCACVGQSSAALYSLHYGINEYPKARQLRTLTGAVNDAAAIEALMRKLGATTLIRTDVTAIKPTSAQFRADMRHLANTTQPGDVIVLTFAGHGDQEKIADHLRNPEEQDGKDEFLLFADFATNNTGLIWDDEIQTLLHALKHRTVVFVNDSCHSGSGARGFGLPTRDAAGVDLSNVALAPTREQKTISDNVLYFGGTSDGGKVSELVFYGARRGGLSAAFEQALRTGADDDANGYITGAELQSHLVAHLKSLSSAQNPALEIHENARSTKLFRAINAPIALALTVQVEGKPAGLKITQFRETGKTQSPDFIWDWPSKQLFRDTETEKKSVARAETEEDVGRELSRWVLLDRMQKKIDPKLKILITDTQTSVDCLQGFSSDGYKENQQVQLSLCDAGEQRYNVQWINIAALGTIQRPADFTRVTIPLGVDHLYAIALPEGMEKLDVPNAAQFETIVDGAIARGARLTYVRFFTE